MKFSTRDLILVTVIVALVVGWCVDHYRQNGKERETAAERDRHANHLGHVVGERASLQRWLDANGFDAKRTGKNDEFIITKRPPAAP
ncbi:MAG: hypothetical protein ACKVP0_02235 [Pirellulaceae bacterium]